MTLVFEWDRAGHIQSVDDTGNVTQDGEQDVDEQVGAASALEEDTQRRQEDGKEDLADVAVGALLAIEVRAPDDVCPGDLGQMSGR